MINNNNDDEDEDDNIIEIVPLGGICRSHHHRMEELTSNLDDTVRSNLVVDVMGNIPT
eukprot:CAMPEP_0194189548 /NCGR_PEP_ID=MMETSP0154-20130528/59522_1 /TAXON_ID=1049557 /ORGANISM="Thalassiothrix antarctica, Strain L6-D1" /LENGTH=57 /DNA_ID=CAMNT_0038910781 /DNA_START=59 /DNA_END=228 /DNA_ORIENTATION=-